MTRRILCATALAAALPLAAIPLLPARAEPQSPGMSLGPSLALQGRVGLQFSHVSGKETQTVGVSDLTLVWQGVDLGAATLGAELALNGIANVSNGEELHNLWAAGVLSFGETAVRLGAPRPVIEAMSPMGGQLSNAALDLAYGRGLASAATILSWQDDGLTPGLALQGRSAGGLDWGASYHRIDGDAKTVEALQLAANYTNGATTVFGSAEHLWGDTGLDDSFELGLVYDGGDWRLGLAAARADALVDGTAARLHVAYDLTPALSLNSTYLHTGDGSLSSLDAEYRLPFGGFARAGAAVSGGDEIYDLTLGMEF